MQKICLSSVFLLHLIISRKWRIKVPTGKSLCSQNKVLCLIFKMFYISFREFWHSQNVLLWKVYAESKHKFTKWLERDGRTCWPHVMQTDQSNFERAAITSCTLKVHINSQNNWNAKIHRTARVAGHAFAWGTVRTFNINGKYLIDRNFRAY